MTDSSAYAFIVGFDHNSAIEGTGIHFQFGKTLDGTDIAFVDRAYGSTKTSGAWFNMNNSDSNSGGWKDSRMRAVICPQFKEAMPTDWKNVVASCVKYTNNVGGTEDSSLKVNATSDDIFLLSEYEIFGVRTNANSFEKNYQAQYTYYANGNSKIKYRSSVTTTVCLWWTRSAKSNSLQAFCYVTSSGSSDFNIATYSRGAAFGFKIA